MATASVMSRGTWASLVQFVRVAARSVWANRVRSVLATTGVVLGCASTITMLAVAEGAKRDALARIEELGTTNIYVHSRNPEAQGGGQDDEETSTSERRQVVARYGITFRDAEVLRSVLPRVRTIAEVAVREADVATRGGLFPSCQIIGVTPEYAKVQSVQVQRGRFISDADLYRSAAVVVLESQTARRIFGPADPIGKLLRFAGTAWYVVGVAKVVERGTESSGGWRLYVPLSAVRTRMGPFILRMGPGRDERLSVDLDRMIIRCRSVADVTPVAQVVRAVLQRAHTKPDYEVTVPLELMEQVRSQRLIWDIVLASIAVVSLLVGGIGIMNIMLATVTERTVEIGVRRAVGAKRRHILVQFLIESVTLSTTGGFLGVAAGLLAPVVVRHLSGISTAVTPEGVLLAFLLSVAVGVVFGVYPARRAASMHPAEALRQAR